MALFPSRQSSSAHRKLLCHRNTHVEGLCPFTFHTPRWHRSNAPAAMLVSTRNCLRIRNLRTSCTISVRYHHCFSDFPYVIHCFLSFLMLFFVFICLSHLLFLSLSLPSYSLFLFIVGLSSSLSLFPCVFHCFSPFPYVILCFYLSINFSFSLSLCFSLFFSFLMLFIVFLSFLTLFFV